MQLIQLNMKNKDQIFNAIEQELIQAKIHLANLNEMLKILRENISNN